MFCNNMEQLKDVFYNPTTGFISANKIYVKLKKEIPLAKIKVFLQSQELNQIYRQSKRERRCKKMIVFSTNNQWQIDLIDFSKYSHWNSGFKYLFCIVDVFSRKAFVVPLKKKSHTTIAMKTVLLEQCPILIQSDNGTEFLNSSFQSLLKQYKIQHTTVQVADHNRQGVVERFNRTIETIISKYQHSRNTNRFVDVLQDIVYNYNHTYHSTNQSSPEEKYHSNPSNGNFKDYFPVINLKVGDKVRILKDRKQFDKGYETKYSKTVYEIIERHGFTFSIKELNRPSLNQKYKYYQLLKIETVESFIPAVINRPKAQESKRIRRIE